MPLTSTQIESILRTGCNVNLTDHTFTSTQIEGMARVAKASNSHLTFNKNTFTSTQIEGIGRAGSGHTTVVINNRPA